MKKFLIPITAITMAAFATVVLAAMAPTKMGDSVKGKVLTNDKGMTLYVFDKDSRASRLATAAAHPTGRRSRPRPAPRGKATTA